jgi:hypothetical protein
MYEVLDSSDRQRIQSAFDAIGSIAEGPRYNAKGAVVMVGQAAQVDDSRQQWMKLFLTCTSASNLPKGQVVHPCIIIIPGRR